MASLHTCLYLMVFLGLILVSSATLPFVVGIGSCPNPGTQDGFTLSNYLGVWYEYERFPNWFEIGLDCTSATYGDNGDGSISVLNSGVFRVNIFGRTVIERTNSITGRATVPDSTRPAELVVSFGGMDMGSNPNYFIVDTDYTTYSVVFSCFELGPALNVQIVWILTRGRGVAPANLATIKSNLEAAGINTNKFISIDQSNCSS